MNRTKAELLLYGSMHAAEQGARINSANNVSLVTTFFMITREGRIEILAWQRDDHPRDAMDDVKRYVKQLDAIGMVVIAETWATTEPGRAAGMPDTEQLDGVIIYGYLPGDRNNPAVETVKSFIREADGALTARNMYLPETVMAWVQEALSK